MLILVIVICAVVAISVLIHYEFLYRLTQLVPRARIRTRFRIVLGIFGALIAHSVEIWVFTAAYYPMHGTGRRGALQGNCDGSLMASAYFSFTACTTLGFGDIEPIGDIRYRV